MQYLKRNTKYSILAFLIIILSMTISISTLAETEIYFSLYDNPQILSNDSPKQKVQNININLLSQDELIEILQISKPLAEKIIALRDSLSGGFKDSHPPQLPEITKIKWREWKEKRITITVN